MLEIKHVSKKYKTKHNEVHALQDINLTIQEKGMVFILGKSGSGKSTLLNVLGGLDSFDEGEIIIGGKSSKTFKQSDFDSYRNTFIGFIFQEYNVMDNFTVKENIALAMQLQGKKASDEEIEGILEEVDLQGLANRKPNELSGGQLQRVAIARALIKQPEIIMADEPTGALDSKTGKQVFDTLKKLSKDKLVLIVSHDKEFAKRYADRIIELKDGKIIQDLSKQMVQPDGLNSRFHYVENAYIQIPDPQVLSKEDMDTILSQMKKHQGEIIIALDEQVNQEMKEKLHIEEGGQAIFQQTNIEMRDTKGTEQPVSFIKSKLPLQSSFKFACANLKLKPFRLAITIILSVVAFTLFGITNTMSQYNKETATFRSMKDTDVNYISIGNNEVITYDDYSYEETTKLTETDYERLQNNFSNVSFIQTFSGYNYGTNLDFSQQIADVESLYETETNYLFYPTMLSALSTITTQDIEENGFTLTGKLAEKDDEIVITKVVADTLMTYGFMEENKDGVYVKKSLQSIEDLLSKTITLTINNESVDFTITGILDTKIDFSRYEALKLSTTESLADYYLQNELVILLQDSYHQLGYVSSTRLTKEIQQYDIYALSNIGFIDIIVQDEYHSPMYAYSSQDVDSDQLVTISDGDLYVSYQQIKNVVIHNTMTLQDYIAQSVSDTMRDDEIMQLVKEAIQTYQKDILQQVQIELYYDDGANVTGTIAGVYVPQELTTDDGDYIVVKEDQLEAYGYQKDGYSYFTVAAMSDDETLQNIIAYTYDDGIENSNYILQNQVMPMLETVNSVVDALQGVLLWIGIGFAIFASVMFCNFIATSIANKQREIGILRAVGARGFDVLKIFLNESFMIAICNWILAVVLCFIATNVMNEFIRDSYGIVVTIFHFGILQILLLCIIAIAVACIASAFPVLKISRKKPIDAIKNRK